MPLPGATAGRPWARGFLIRRQLGLPTSSQGRIDVRDARKNYIDERMPADKIMIRKRDAEAEQAWMRKFMDDSDYEMK